MAEVTRTMAEWIELDQRDRRDRREAMKLLKDWERNHPPVMMMASGRPVTVETKSSPPQKPARAERSSTAKPVKVPTTDRNPVEPLPAEPTDRDAALQLGITEQQLSSMLGGLSVAKLAGMIGMDVRELVDALGTMASNLQRETGLSRAERARVVLARLRLAGRKQGGRLIALERAKAAGRRGGLRFSRRK